MDTIFDLTEKIKLRPPMYIGSNKLSDMHTFLLGYRSAVIENQYERLFTDNGISFQYFNFFVGRKYNCSSFMGYANIILKQTENDEEKALRLFFNVIKEFEELEIKSIWKLDLSEENRHYNRTEPSVPKILHDGDEKPLYSDSENIYKIKLSDDTIFLAVKDKDTKYLHIDCDVLVFEKHIDEYLKKCFGEIKWKDFSGEISEIKLM